MTLDETRSEIGFGGTVTTGGGEPDWRDIDRALRRIARSERRLEVEKGRWLLAARDAQVHRQLGFATFPEYVEHVFGYGPRDTRDRLRVAEALLDLPQTTAALAAGHLPYTGVRALTAVLEPTNESTWLDRVKGRTVRDIEAMVSGHKRGDMPGDPADPDLRTFALRFELSPEDLALYRDARREVVRNAGHELSEAEILAAMCRAVFRRGPENEARSNKPPYQVFVTQCEECERTWQEGAGEPLEVGPTAAARARCDAEIVRRTPDGRSRASRTIPPSVRRLVMRRDHHRCVVPGCRNSEHLEVHHLVPRARGGDNHPDRLAVLCSGHHDALHKGLLVIRGKPGALHFEHADGRSWGTPPPEPAAAALPPFIDELRAALRGLDIKPAAVESVIQHTMSRVCHVAPIEDWLREALLAYRRNLTL